MHLEFLRQENSKFLEILKAREITNLAENLRKVKSLNQSKQGQKDSNNAIKAADVYYTVGDKSLRPPPIK